MIENLEKYEIRYKKEGMTKAIIFDIDGTISDCNHRQHYLKKKPKDWDGFYKNILNDTPNIWCVNIVERMSSDFKIIFVTGRPEKYRKETEDWLLKHKIFYFALFMRTNEDHRQDFIIKKEIYEKYIKDKFDVLFVVEDRKQVVDMWRKEGLVCLQCADGNF